MLALGYGDLVTLGRALITDPDWPRKALEEREDVIRPCMGCNQGCLANTFFDRPITCLANPLCGTPEEVELPPAAQRKNILVVGGGPAGCEAAFRLAQRGHTVTLWEKSDRLGGQLNLAAKLPARRDFLGLMDYYAVNLPRLGVQVELGREGTAEEIAALGFDHVVVAVGGAPNVTALPTEPGCVPVFTSTQVIRGEAFPGKRVVVIGGSYLGVETARLLARQGSLSPEQLFHLSMNHAETPERLERLLNTSARQVWLVEKGPKIGYGYESGTAWPALGELGRLGVELMKNSLVTAIGAGGVLCQVTDREGNTAVRTIECDTVVVASRRPPRRRAGQGAGGAGDAGHGGGQRQTAVPGHRGHQNGCGNRLRPIRLSQSRPGRLGGIFSKELENMTKFFFALLENCGILVLSIGGDHHVATRSDASSVIYTHTDSPGGGGESPPVPAGRQLPRQRLHRLGPSAPGL